MFKYKKGLVAITLMSLFVTGCSSMKDENALTGESEFNSTSTGAAVGATSGAAVGAIGGAAGAAIGAVIGGAAGGYYGYTQDEAKDELRDELEDLGIEVTDVDGVIHVKLQNNLLFEKGADVISGNGQEILDTFLSIVKQLESSNYLKISGHTDNTGNRDFNISLSEQRAKKIAFYLFENGFPAKQIDYSGYADLMPVADNDTEEGRKLNRRVSIEIIPSVVKY